MGEKVLLDSKARGGREGGVLVVAGVIGECLFSSSSSFSSSRQRKYMVSLAKGGSERIMRASNHASPSSHSCRDD